jgi:hypothetical protein
MSRPASSRLAIARFTCRGEYDAFNEIAVIPGWHSSLAFIQEPSACPIAFVGPLSCAAQTDSRQSMIGERLTRGR